MANVLLTRKYKGRAVGETLTDLTDTEANGFVVLGLGQIIKDEEQPAPKKAGKGSDTE